MNAYALFNWLLHSLALVSAADNLQKPMYYFGGFDLADGEIWEVRIHVILVITIMTEKSD